MGGRVDTKKRQRHGNGKCCFVSEERETQRKEPRGTSDAVQW